MFWKVGITLREKEKIIVNLPQYFLLSTQCFQTFNLPQVLYKSGLCGKVIIIIMIGCLPFN